MAPLAKIQFTEVNTVMREKRKEFNFEAAQEVVPEIDIWDIQNPRSLINLLPDIVREKLLDHYQTDPQLFTLGEDQLQRHLRTNNMSVARNDNLLRQKFWEEYYTVQVERLPKMRISFLYGRILTNEAFHAFLNSPTRLAWVACPFADDLIKKREMLDFILEELRDAVSKPHTNEKGMMIPSAVREKANVYKMIHEILHGAATQRIHSVSVTANEHRIITGNITNVNSEAIEARLRGLEKMEREALHLPEPTRTVVPTNISVKEVILTGKPDDSV